ncbi:Aste57867_21569 [Aphanomyces stellatus]|uniref:Aste57867_21569 protein n=1 Tax=Aphanomyces stellatus TaxID=120398 RepID=A0A485LHV9_9STRA|nr:hypothetical protein As57867_021500 [Aphanomyces stellatus]VFT98239.1 Aste57867_21569 [Aphanomyces stellatus]
MTSFLKWPKKQTSVLSNQDEDLLEHHIEGSKDANVLDPQPGTPPAGRTKRSNSLYAMFHSSKNTAAADPTQGDDAPTPHRHSLVEQLKPSMTNQDDLETPSLLKPAKGDTNNNNSDKKAKNLFGDTNKWIQTTKRRLSNAVIPKRQSPNAAIDTERYVGEKVHTAAGAGVVTEVKPDGSAVVRLVSTEYVNCSMVIVEKDGEIESLPALPQDTVITPQGVGTVVTYNPKTREYTVETMEDTTFTFEVDQIHPMSANETTATDESEGDTSSNQTPVPSLRSSFLKKMALATPKFPQMLKSRSFGNPTAPKYHAGQAVMTQFGDGVVVEIQPPSSPNARPIVVVQLSFGGQAFLQLDAIKQGLKASVGDAVLTRFGHGHVAAIAQENVFVVNVDGEEMYVHATEVTKLGNKSGGLFHMFKK